ncbi:hypothetical protein [Agromyces aerolatus]|uniref:hypothetical protein n=1 Tax=Agromyces sp. LY-1074 TaxID=3074080 RepID=UPI00285CA28A|nr:MULTISPECIES: hypothetical protein [unclassified Agromyces]MDR5701950.1 hypothetical protein [Agromyces sp. LY-1074]MDR5708177.1 hypothetical protein [Agromyces sp. LY-1358]
MSRTDSDPRQRPTTLAPDRATERAEPLRRVFRDPAGTAESLESAALVLGGVGFVVVGLIAWVVFWNRELPISGSGSLTEFVAVTCALVAIAAFVFGRLVLRVPSPTLRAEVGPGLSVPGARLHWFDLIALALAHAVIVLLGWTGLGAVLELSFIGAEVYAFPGALLAGVGAAVTMYAVFLSAARLTPMLLSLVLAVFLVVGALASMLSSSDPLWWQKNLSALGIAGDVSALAFNLTLIIAGAIVTTIARYGTATLPTSTPRELSRRNRVRIGFVLIGVFLGCVGIFPVNEFFWLHNSVATGMAVVFAVLVFALPRLAPSMPRVFVLLGYVFVGVIALLAVFFVTGYYNLTAVELVAAVLIFAWIILFLRSAGVIRRESPTQAESPITVAAPTQTDASGV